MTKAGTLGFGVGVCPEDISKLEMEPLPGCDDVKTITTATIFINPAEALCAGSLLSCIE